MKADERQWVEAMVKVGCIVCREEYSTATPAHYHHLLSGGQRIGHKAGIPLCPMHHTGGGEDQGHVPRHSRSGDGGLAAFELAYGPEVILYQHACALAGLEAEACVLELLT